MDLTLTRSSAFGVTEVEGHTYTGVEFVDAWLLGTVEVIDSGRIVVPTEIVQEIEKAAQERGLTIEHETSL